MATPFARVAMTEFTLGSANTYLDVDLTDYGVSEDAIGVWLRIDSNTSYLQYADVRANGSTDTRSGRVPGYAHGTVVVAADANCVIEALTTHESRVDFYVMGYMLGPSVTMFTNALDVTNQDGAFVDTDVSEDCPSAVAVLLAFTSDQSTWWCAARKNGSTDDRRSDSVVVGIVCRACVIGVDGSQVFEQAHETSGGESNTYVYVAGYVSSVVVTMNTNATDRSLSTTDSWTDLAALPTGAKVGFYHVHQTSSSYDRLAGLRKNGESEEPYGEMQNDNWATWIVECDANRKVEGKIDSSNVDFWEIGYVTSNDAPTAPTSLYCEGASLPGAVTDTTPEFSAVYNDPDTGDIANYAYVQVATSSAFSTLKWDSGWISISNVNAGSRCGDISYAGETLSLNGTTFYWRVKFKDDDGAEGIWSDAATFRMQFNDAKLCQESLSMTDGKARSAARTQGESLPMAAALVRAAMRSESLGMAVAGARSGLRVVSEDIAVSDGDFFVGVKTLSEGVSMADGTLKVAEREQSEAVGMADGKARQATKAVLSESLEMGAAMSRVGAHFVGDGLGMWMGDSVTREAVRSQSEALEMVASLGPRVAARIVEEALALVDSMGRVYSFPAFLEAMGMEAAALRTGWRTASDSLQMSDGDFQAAVRVVSESMLMADLRVAAGTHGAFLETVEMTVAGLRVGVRIVAESQEMADAVVRIGARVVSEALAVVANAARVGTRWSEEVLQMSDGDFRAAVVPFAEEMALVDARSGTAVRSPLEDELGMSDGISRTAQHPAVEALSMAGAIAREAVKTLPEAMLLIPRVAIFREGILPEETQLVVDALGAGLRIERLRAEMTLSELLARLDLARLEAEFGLAQLEAELDVWRE